MTRSFLHLISYMHPSAGGPPVVVDQWCSHLSASGKKCHVLTTDAYSEQDPRDDWISDYRSRYGLDVFSLRGPRGFGYSPQWKSALADRLPRTDLVHIHNLWSFPNQIAASMCHRRNVPFVVSTHGMLDPHSLARKSWKKRIYGRLREWPALRRAERLIFTHAEEERLARCSVPGLPAGSIVPLGAELPEASREVLAAEFQDRYPSWCDRPLVLFLGRIHEKKGLDLLLPAMAKIAQDRRPRLVLVGPGESNYVSQLHATVHRLDLADDVAFAGPRGGREKQAMLAAADLFVLPSYQENFAITVVEALHGGTPVILSDRVNLCDDLLAHDAAVRCELTPDSIADQITTLMASADRRAALSENGRRLAAERYTWKKSAARLIDVYQGICS